MRTHPGYDQEKTQGLVGGEGDPCVPFELQEKLRADRLAAERAERFRDECNGSESRPMSSAEILHELFSYHPPTPNTLPKFAAINQAAKNFAEIILQNCPPSADRSDAIRRIREARMTANAAIALNGLSL
jgi:hypothetical protein